jgi:hypothetical protein
MVRYRLPVAAALALLATACTDSAREDATPPDRERIAIPNAATPPEQPPLPDQAPENGQENAQVAAPEGGAARYVGRWASKPELCEHGAWRFEQRRLVTAGEVRCDFSRVAQVADGYDVAAQCLAEGARSTDTVRLRFADGTMTVTAKMWPGVPLQKCG